MSLDVTHSIKRILLSEQTVSVAGLGIFYLKYYSAKLNRLSNQLSPPYREITFNHKTEVKSDRLVEALNDEYGLDDLASKEVIKDYVSKIQNELQSGHVDLNGLGALELDENGNLLYDNEKADLIFGKSDYPTLTYEPIKREELVHEEEKPGIIAAHTDVLEKEKKNNLFRVLSILLTSLLIISLLLWIFTNQSPDKIHNSEEISSVDQSGINTSPADFKEDTQKIETNEVSIVPKDNSPNRCSIIVGSFGSQANIDKMIKKINLTTYESFLQKLDGRGLTRVGVHVPCDNINQHLTEIKRSLESGAWILVL